MRTHATDYSRPYPHLLPGFWYTLCSRPDYTVDIDDAAPTCRICQRKGTTTMVVAYYMPHNDGTASGILDAPGQDTGLTLVNLYEVDGQIKTFATRSEAEEWLTEQKQEQQ